jgi:hypothetical protein
VIQVIEYVLHHRGAGVSVTEVFEGASQAIAVDPGVDGRPGAHGWPGVRRPGQALADAVDVAEGVLVHRPTKRCHHVAQRGGCGNLVWFGEREPFVCEPGSARAATHQVGALAQRAQGRERLVLAVGRDAELVVGQRLSLVTSSGHSALSSGRCKSFLIRFPVPTERVPTEVPTFSVRPAR